MHKSPATVAVLLLVLPAAFFAQTPRSNADTIIASRRQGLEQLGANLDEFARRNAQLDDATKQQMERAVAELARALENRDDAILGAAVSDLLNGVYRAFPPERIVTLIVPLVKTPEHEQERMRLQGLLIEHLASKRNAPHATGALPALVALIADDKAPVYIRGQAIDAAGRIGGNDPTVVAAFIKAAKNPNPQSTSGVHERIARQFGEMGSLTPEIKEALAAVSNRGPWYQDPAFLALGKLTMDKESKSLDHYLDVLRQLDKAPMERAAAAFLHVQKLINPQAPFREPNSSADISLRSADRSASAIARPVLLKIVADRPHDVYSRAALRTLEAIGPGSGKDTTAIIIKVLLRDQSWDAIYVLQKIEPADPRSVEPLTAGFAAAMKMPSWHTRQVFAKALLRYGKDSAKAAPLILEALRGLPPAPSRGHADFDMFATYLETLAAMGGDTQGIHDQILEYLAGDSAFLKRTKSLEPHYRALLLQTMAKIGLPADGSKRKAALHAVRAGLRSDIEIVFAASAGAVIAQKSLPADEAKMLVGDLARVLKSDFRFRDPAGQLVAVENDPFRVKRFEGLETAVRALAALGPSARDALPALRSIARQEIVDVSNTFRPEPPMNHVIRAARLAIQAIQGD